MKSDSSTVILIILFIGNVKLSKDYPHTKVLSFAAHLLPVYSYKSFGRKVISSQQ